MLKSVVACPLGPKWLQVLTDWHACNPVSVINSDRITLTMVCMERGFQDLPVGNFKFPLGAV
jgi:hypothetical protein